MNLLDRIDEDLKRAMKEKEEQALSTLRMVRSALKNKQIELMRDLKEDDVLTVLQSQVKQIAEAIEGAIKAGRDDLKAKAEAELAVIKKYLPPELSSEELEAAVKEVIDDMKATAKDMGKVMGVVMQKVKGRVDGSKVKETVQKLLS